MIKPVLTCELRNVTLQFLCLITDFEIIVLIVINKQY